MAKCGYYARFLLLLLLILLSNAAADQFAVEVPAHSTTWVTSYTHYSGPVVSRQILPRVVIKAKYLGGEVSFYQPYLYTAVNCSFFTEKVISLHNGDFISSGSLFYSSLRGPPVA